MAPYVFHVSSNRAGTFFAPDIARRMEDGWHLRLCRSHKAALSITDARNNKGAMVDEGGGGGGVGGKGGSGGGDGGEGSFTGTKEKEKANRNAKIRKTGFQCNKKLVLGSCPKTSPARNLRPSMETETTTKTT